MFILAFTICAILLVDITFFRCTVTGALILVTTIFDVYVVVSAISGGTIVPATFDVTLRAKHTFIHIICKMIIIINIKL
jgi:hypothetical protein